MTNSYIERMRVKQMRKLLVDAMRREHNANEYKGGWLDRGIKRHRRDLDYHVAKFHAALLRGDEKRIIEYMADICNHAMFAADDVLREGFEDAVKARHVEPAYVFPGRGFYVRLILCSPSLLLRPRLYWGKLWTAIVRGHNEYEGERQNKESEAPWPVDLDWPPEAPVK